MTAFPLHTRATAPFEAKPFLEQAGQSIGYVPALLAQMAEAPALLEGYAALSAIFRKSGLSPREQQLVLRTAAVALGSRYCTPAHVARAREAALDEDAIADARAGRPLVDRRLEALRRFTQVMVRAGRPQPVPRRRLHACQRPGSRAGRRAQDPVRQRRPDGADPA
ncbi:MAG TPA: carboxymuconolactone decarboxylase family protein [Caulobacter sp.]|nr:carboxymuconolactone decarboxylase family protein [Caulobacter sp.]